jgi:hypothetical protein
MKRFTFVGGPVMHVTKSSKLRHNQCTYPGLGPRFGAGCVGKVTLVMNEVKLQKVQKYRDHAKNHHT